MRANPAFDAAAAITELGVGEALVSFLDDKGRPNVVERAFVLPPSSRLGPLTAAERQQAIQGSLLYGHYEKLVDRESAYEKLTARVAEAPQKVGAGGTVTPEAAADGQAGGLLDGALGEILFGRTGPRGGKTDGLVQAAAKSVIRTLGSQVGREIARGVLGSLLGGKKR
jgi:DNA helicase HerA-like ATPase